MKLLTVLACIVFMGASSAFAESTAPVIATLSIAEKHLKVGETLYITVSRKNVSQEDISIKMFVPYFTAPEITNMQTGKPASWWTPPVDGPVMLETIVLKPNQVDEFIYSIKSVDEHEFAQAGGEKLGNLLQSHNGLIAAIPGSYSIKFTLEYQSITGMSSPAIETPPETFEIIK